MRIDYTRIDLVGVDLVRIDLMGVPLLIIETRRVVRDSVASPGVFLETSQAPAIAYSTVQIASYSLGATGLSL